MVDDPIDPPKPKKKPAGVDDDGPAFEIDLPEVEITAPRPGTPSTPGTNIPFPSEPVLPKPGGPVTPNNPIPTSGGSGGSSTSATSGDVTVKDIKNNLSNPCLQAMLNAAISKQLKSWVAKTVNSLGGNGGNFNLDQDSLPGKSKEVIATAIYHEIIHGVFAINNVPIILQHETMAESYRQKIAEGLKALFPAMSDGDANALGWIGLVKTYQFSSLQMKDFQNYTGTALDILKIAVAY